MELLKYKVYISEITSVEGKKKFSIENNKEQELVSMQSNL